MQRGSRQFPSQASGRSKLLQPSYDKLKQSLHDTFFVNQQNNTSLTKSAPKSLCYPTWRMSLFLSFCLFVNKKDIYVGHPADVATKSHPEDENQTGDSTGQGSPEQPIISSSFDDKLKVDCVQWDKSCLYYNLADAHGT